MGADLTSLDYKEGIPVFNGIDYFWVPSILRALRFLARQKPDIVVLQWWTGAVLHSYLALCIAAKRHDARVVIEFHEIQDSGESALPVARLYVKALIRPLLRMADAYAVHSEYDRRALGDRYALGSKPVAVVPVGSYDHLIVRADSVEAAEGNTESQPNQGRRCGRGAAAGDAGATRILYFGTIRPYKGVEYLIEAFNSLSAAEASQFILEIVGETWEHWTRPAELIDSSPHKDRIAFVNRYVHDDEVGDFFERADAVVLPYLRSSASGPLHMAMSYGLPVAVSSVGGLTEAAQSYAGVRFLRPADIDDLRSALLDLPSLTGSSYADPHSWEKSAEALARVF